MKISKFFLVRLYLFVLIFLLPYFKFFFEHYFFNLRITSDSQGSYYWYQYVYNYYSENWEFPGWIDFLDSGLPITLPLHFELSIFSYFFIILGNIFKINPYFSYISMLNFFYSLVMYAIFINLDLKKNKIIIFSIIVFLLAISYNPYAQFLSWGSFIFLICFYYSKKFAYNLKVSSLSQLFFVNLFGIYSLPLYIFFPIIYFSLFTVLFYFFYYWPLNYQKKIYDFFTTLLHLKSLKYFVSIVFFTITFFLILSYLKDTYHIEAVGRESGSSKLIYKNYLESMSFIDFKHLLNSLTYLSIFSLNLSTGPVIFTLFILSIFLFFNNLERHIDIFFIFLLLLIGILTAVPQSFYFFHKYIYKIIFNYFPIMDYVRYTFHLLIMLKIFFYLSAGYVISYFSEKIINKNIFYFCSLLLFFYYTEFLFSYNKNSVDTEVWYEYIFGVFFIMVMIFYNLFYSLEKKSKTVLFLLIIISIPYYISSYSQGTKIFSESTINKIDKINFNKNSFDKIDYCFKSSDIIELYQFYSIKFGSRHNQIFLNTPYKPCNILHAQRLRGSKKNYNLSLNNARASFKDDDLLQKGTVQIGNINYPVFNFYSNNLKIEVVKINNRTFQVTLNNLKEGSVRISYSNNWKILDQNLDKVSLQNNNGYLAILNNTNKEKLTIKIFYENTLLDFINKFNLMLSIPLIILFILLFYKKLILRSLF